MPRHKPLPTQAELREAFHYNPETGELIRRSGRAAGTNAITFEKKRPVVWIKKEQYAAARLIWKLVTGEALGNDFVVHANHDWKDNSWDNLKRVPKLGDCSLPPGVRRVKASGRWVSWFIGCGVQLYLGTFGTVEEAVAAQKRVRLVEGPEGELLFDLEAG